MVQRSAAQAREALLRRKASELSAIAVQALGELSGQAGNLCPAGDMLLNCSSRPIFVQWRSLRPDSQNMVQSGERAHCVKKKAVP